MVVANAKGSFLDRTAAEKMFQRPGQAYLMSPRLGIGANLTSEDPLQRPGADTNLPADGLERRSVAERVEQYRCGFQGSWFFRHSYLYRKGTGASDMECSEIAHCAMLRISQAQLPNPHCLDDQLAQERLDGKHFTTRSGSLYQTSANVKGMHGDRDPHANTVGQMRGNPKSKAGWNEPDGSAGVNLHDAARCIDELVGAVRMLRDEESGRVFVGQRCDGDTPSRIKTPDESRLSHAQHPMSR